MTEVVRSLDTGNLSVDGPLLSSFQSCRVLAMNDVRGGDLKHLGKLLNLRHLEIRWIRRFEFPKEIGNLKCLQTLIIPSSQELPPTVCELKQLMCLDAPVVKNFPVDRLGNLVHLEELMLQVHREEDADVFLVELGKLTRLRVLHILFHIDYHSMALVQSLNNLQEIRELIISHTDDTDDVCMAVDSTWKSWMAPRQLWRLETDMVLPSSQLVSCCRRLRYLNMFVAERVDMKILALLPELFYLQLHDPTYYGHYKDGCIIVGADGFKNLRICIVPRELKFLPGAMPRLESLRFVVCAAPAERRALDLGLGNLVSLKDVELVIDCCGCVHAEVEETKAVLTRAVEDHPNRPTIAFENLENYVEETLVSTAVWKSIQGL
ncbi:hypothetical protein QOZ80_7AG0581460 [Eleusine coracana subsp. coracana]|nr:hypothetical protein QOZ80_7AG0581460 [Eleusine coracana subsp. coracana]